VLYTRTRRHDNVPRPRGWPRRRWGSGPIGRSAARTNNLITAVHTAVSPGGSLFTTGAAHVRLERSAGRGTHEPRHDNNNKPTTARAPHDTHRLSLSHSTAPDPNAFIVIVYFFLFRFLFPSSAIVPIPTDHRYTALDDRRSGPSDRSPLGSRRQAIISVS